MSCFLSSQHSSFLETRVLQVSELTMLSTQLVFIFFLSTLRRLILGPCVARVPVGPSLFCEGMASSLEDLLVCSGLDTSLTHELLTEGWTMSTFACCASSYEAFDQVIQDLFPSRELSLRQKASLRAAYKSAFQQMSGPSGTSASEPTGPSSSSSTPWSEGFVPKLDPQRIKELKSQFLSNYPSEILNSDTMPSTRLLSLHHQLQRKQWVWIPWKYRMSVSRAEEVVSQRAAKLPRVETVSFSTLLLDDPPALEISNSGMGTDAIRNMLEVHSVAIAICRGARAQNLKAYTHKFMSFLTQKLDPESGLRTASILEAQSADRQVWTSISDLMSDRDWNMDDALHEFTTIRSDLAGYLQVANELHVHPFHRLARALALLTIPKGHERARKEKEQRKENPVEMAKCNGSLISRRMDNGNNFVCVFKAANARLLIVVSCMHVRISRRMERLVVLITPRLITSEHLTDYAPLKRLPPADFLRSIPFHLH